MRAIFWGVVSICDNFCGDPEDLSLGDSRAESVGCIWLITSFIGLLLNLMIWKNALNWLGSLTFIEAWEGIVIISSFGESPMRFLWDSSWFHSGLCLKIRRSWSIWSNLKQNQWTGQWNFSQSCAARLVPCTLLFHLVNWCATCVLCSAVWTDAPPVCTDVPPPVRWQLCADGWLAKLGKYDDYWDLLFFDSLDTFLFWA